MDRWRKSTAYTDMTLAEQGAYRNLLDELWLREGPLPDDDRILGRISGDPVEWPTVRAAVMARFTKTPEGWVNETQTEVMAATRRYSDSQSAKGRKGADARWNGHKDGRANGRAIDPANGTANGPAMASVSVSVSGSVSESGAVSEKETPSESCRRKPTTALPPVVVMWNEKVAGTPLKSVRVWSSKRDRVLKARLREEGDLAVWGRAMDHLIASDFHRGVNDQGWVAGLDFLLQPGQAPKWLDLAHGGPPVKADPEVTPQLRRLMGGV